MRDAGRIGFDIKGSYNSEMKYEFLDVVYYQNSSYVAKKETTGNPPADNNEFWQILARGESSGGDADASDMTVKFEQATSMTNISTGEKLSSLFGKIKKWFSVFPSTDLFGKINNLSDFNQINNTYRFWNIGSIDATYAAELGIERNVGDFKCLLLSYNGDGETFYFGNLILSSPRLTNDYYLVQMWEGAPHVTYSKAEVPSLTNNDLATIPGTAWDAVRGAQIRKDLDKINSDLKKSGIMDNLLLTTRINDSFMFEDLIRKQSVTFFTNWTDKTNFPVKYGSGIVLPAEDSRNRYIIYTAGSGLYYGYYYANNGVTWTKIIK